MSPITRRLFAIIALILLSPQFVAAQSGTAPDDIYWDGQFYLSGLSGFSGSVKALTADGNDLFVGGTLLNVAGAPSRGIVRWDRTSRTWLPVGNGVNGAVHAIAVSGDALYVGGAFVTIDGDTVNSIARWNRTTGRWSPLGSGVHYKGKSGAVYAIAIAGDSIYVGGRFDIAGGDSAHYVAVWNIRTATWHELGNGVDWDIFALAADGNDIYVGGGFSRAGGINARKIARWDRSRSSWYSLGGGRELPVYAIAAKGGEVYAGGMDFMAKYGANGWTVLGDGINGTVHALTFSGNDLYASGTFERADGRTVNNVTRWDGTAWQPLGTGVFFGSEPNTDVAALTAANGELYVGGTYSAAGTVLADGLATWNGTEWKDLNGNTVETGNGVVGTPRVMALADDAIYVGGSSWLSARNGVRSPGALVYDRSRGEWYAPGEGLRGQYLHVNSVVPHGDHVFFGGQFSLAGSDSARNIAVWNRSTGMWRRLGNGIFGSVKCMAPHGDTLVVGGSFRLAGDDSVRNIAAWDIIRQRWYPLGNGVGRLTDDSSATVDFMVVAGNSLYVAGDFTRAGTLDAGHLARWNLAEGKWERVGNGVFGGGLDTLIGNKVIDITRVLSMSASGDRLVVTGNFSHVGQLDANGTGILDLRSGEWSTLPNALLVRYTALSGNWLYAWGTFLGAGGDTLQGLAVADIRTDVWRLLGSGITRGYPSSLAVDETGLYVAGSIEEAGGKQSLGIARWMNVPASASDHVDVGSAQVSVYPNPFSHSTTFGFLLDRTETVRLEISTPDGSMVVVPIDATFEAGHHAVDWRGTELPDGIYLYRLRIGRHLYGGSVMLLR